MKCMFSMLAAVAIGVTGCLVFSCKQTGEVEPLTDFAPYIGAFTGGMVHSDAQLVVELTQEQPQEIRLREGNEKLFSFTPALKGTVDWADARTVRFTPEQGALKPGTSYKATFALGRMLKVDRKLARFDFSFLVAADAFRATLRPIEIQPVDRTVTVRGELLFSNRVRRDDVRKMLSARLASEPVDVTVEGGERALSFAFAVGGLQRTDENRTLSLSVDGAPVKIRRRETLSVDIPARDSFRLLDSEVVYAPEYGLCLTFSDLISPAQDLEGLVTLDNVSGGYTTRVRGNQVLVYFTRPAATDGGEVRFTVDRGLRNQAGNALAMTQERTLPLANLKPQVEILATGTIMPPDSGRLILPFRSVALRAVDLKIIRIFENNVLMFLQDNKLSQHASYQMRRAGRLVYRQTLRLDDDPTAGDPAAGWRNHSVDLTGLIRQQPGAVYRVELSFKREYAAYECVDDEMLRAAATDPDRTPLPEGNRPNTDDEAYWDAPESYYYEGYDVRIDWNRYDWSETDDPCKYSYYVQTSRKAVANVFASNLGLLAKSNADHKVWAAVTNLTDTKPVSGARVTAYTYQLQPMGRGVTDEEGFVVLALKSRPFVLVAEAGAQKAYLRMVDGEENLLSRFDVGGTELKKGLKGYIYGERGVWRPGDTLHLAFMLEDRERRVPEHHPVSLEIFNPQGQFYRKIVSTDGANGLYIFHVPTRADDPTGLWNGYVKIGGATFHKGLRVETVKPNRLKIRLDLPPLIDASRERIPAGIHAQWLTGATARRLKAKVEFALDRLATPFKGYEAYVFDNPAVLFPGSRTELFDGALNETGDVRFEMKTPSATNAPGMLRARITCRVFEPGGDAGILVQTAPFSPYTSYVGINFNRKKEEAYLSNDEDHLFDVVTLSPEGRPVDRRDLEYRIYRIGWSWWWERTNESFDSYINNSSYKPVFEGKIHTVNGHAKIRFRIDHPGWGRYLVYVRDPSGHATGGAVSVDWPSWRGRSDKQDPEGVRMLTFSLDKPTYETGQEAQLTIPATASEGRALVALENGSEVIRREWVTLRAGEDTRFAFRVTEQMTPNIYVHVSLLQPHAASADLPIRMYGVMPLFATNRETILHPVLTMADVLKPETDFEVKVKERSGKPMTYTLAIVDEGLLDLTNFRTPDPWNEFYAREALGVRTWDMFDDVMGAYAGRYGSLFTVGGDAELNNSSARANRFKPVTLYVGPVTLRAGEEKKHTLRLPAYVGSVRVMVVAGQNGAYGKTDKTTPVRAPLMLLSSLPRVLGTNERIRLPVNVFALEEGVKQVTVTVETTGKLQAASPPGGGDAAASDPAAAGSGRRTVTFAAPGDEMVYFPMMTGAETGLERVTITASGGGHTSRETIEVEVRNANPPNVTFRSEVIEEGGSAEFAYELDGAYEENWAKVEMSRIPGVDVSRRFDFLYDYRHACTEQLTSCAFPQLFLSDFKEPDRTEAESARRNVTDAIGQLYKRQLPNGGFMYWPGQREANDWVCSYAGSFLILARERGYEVSSSVVRKWIAYQQGIARKWRSDAAAAPGDERYAYRQPDLLQAYRLYSLALADAPEMGAMNRLREVKDLSQQARWRLATAYALCGKTDAANELAFNAATEVAPYSSANQTCGSSERDEAMILEALVLMGRNREAFRLAQRVSANLSRERYFSTQSTAYAMIAMGQLASKMSGDLRFEWSVNGTTPRKVDTGKAVFQTKLPTNPSKGTVRVRNTGSGPLYFSLATKTRPVVDRLPAVAGNLKVAVSYTDLAGNPIKADQLMQGTDFYAVVKVSNVSGYVDYSDVALTHIIPSGWEIFNERMTAAAAGGSGSGGSNGSGGGTAGNDASGIFSYQDIRDDRVMTYFDLRANRHKEIKIRLQASYAGTFVLPAILCEAMYDASARARTTSGRVTVQ
jgi:uncharacterized protein YfaS (alpha-2-macroglobulin family)